MHHWDRDTSSRLQRISTPVEQGCEVSVHSDQMDPLLEEQQSQCKTPTLLNVIIVVFELISGPMIEMRVD